MVLASNDQFQVSLASSSKIGDFWYDQVFKLHWNRCRADHDTHWISSEGSYLVLHPNNTTSTDAGAGAASPDGSTASDPSSTADIEPDAEPLGIILALPYANKTGWLGFFIVDEAHRGEGGGRLLFDAALKYLESKGVTTIGLDAVQDQVGRYKKSGFEPAGTVKALERQSLSELPMVPEGSGPLAEDADAARVLLSKTKEQLADLTGATGKSLLESDMECTGFERRELWLRSQALLDREDSWGLAITKLDNLDELRSWILVRDCGDGYKIGPLYATSKLHALVLLRAVMAKIAVRDGGSEKRLSAEVWCGNPDALGVFQRMGFHTVFDFERMWLDGKVPDAQAPGGKASREAYAWFCAGEG
ncbi:acyl-CoA N-acyltransferase [Phyllosticta capitalensis]